MFCICQRALDTGFTGQSAADTWLLRHYDQELLRPDFHALCYRWFASGAFRLAPGTAEIDEPTELELRTYRRIEDACQSFTHYPDLTLEQTTPGRAVYTSSDPERQEEDQLDWDRRQWELLQHPFGRVERDYDYDRDVVREAASEGLVTDVLTYQRLSRAEKAHVDRLHETRA